MLLMLRHHILQYPGITIPNNTTQNLPLIILLTCSHLQLSNMQPLLQKFTQAPLRYLSSLRSLSPNSLLLKHTTLYPALPLALLTTLLTLLAFAGYLLFYFITVQPTACYAGIRYGIIALAAIYPIESVAIFMGMCVAIGEATSHLWRVVVVIGGGLVVGGFAFGGLGCVFLCSIGSANQLLIPAGFLKSNAFVQAVVYFYLAFFGLYLVLIPLVTLSYNKTNKDNPEPGCGAKFCCVIYYFFQVLYVISAVFIIVIKVIGPVLLVYVMVQAVRAGLQSSVGDLGAFFGLGIVVVVGPGVVLGFGYVLSRFLCKGKDEGNEGKENSEDKQSKEGKDGMDSLDSSKNTLSNNINMEIIERSIANNSVFLSNKQSKLFGEEPGNGIGNQML